MPLDDVKKLIDVGKEKGYFAYNEVNDLIPNDVRSPEDLDDVLATIGTRGMDVLERQPKLPSSALEKRFAKEVEIGEGVALDLTPGVLETTSDPARIYLREMGVVPLLTREGEVDIAKRIERGQLRVLKALSRSPVVIRQILSIGEDLKSGVRSIKEIVVFDEEEITEEILQNRVKDITCRIGELQKCIPTGNSTQEEDGSMKNKASTLCMALLIWLACSFLVAPSNLLAQQVTTGKGTIRTYYVAADEVEWDYAPSGTDQMMGMPFDARAKTYMERGPHRIGKVYRKAIYREYTDATFTTLKPRAAEWEHAGILGPVLRAEVGDIIKVEFKNNASRPYSMHPHGVFYHKASEGSPYSDGVLAADKKGDSVAPGEIFTYVWEVPERAGPGPNDPSSVVWLYHAHVNELKDVNAGLVGALIVTARGKARPDGTPKDVDRECITLFMIFDENQSWYLDKNIQTYVSDPKGVSRAEQIPTDTDGIYSLNGTGFVDSNFRNTINGLQYANLPMMTMKVGQRVRWYLISVGFGFNFHTPHWHGNVVVQDGRRTDVVLLSPAQMLTVDMVPDDPGTWLFHCHVSDHMEAGMVARYQVLPLK